MILDYVLGGIALAGIVIVVTVFVRKFPKLSAIDTTTIQSERESKMKQDLIERRLERKLGTFRLQTLGRLGAVIQRGRLLARQVYWKLREIERDYRRRARLQLSPSRRADLQRKVAVLLDEADAALKDGRLTEAEQRCIEAIALEPKGLAAYQLLGDVYIESKDFAHAQEVFAHAIELSRRKYRIKSPIKLRPTDAQEYGGHTPDVAELYYDESLALQQLDRLPEAIRSCAEATRLVLNNPKYLHTLFDLAIAGKEKMLANRTLKKLREANPENNRLEELEAQLAAQ